MLCKQSGPFRQVLLLCLPFVAWRLWVCMTWIPANSLSKWFQMCLVKSWRTMTWSRALFWQLCQVPFLEKEMAVAVGDHGTDFCVAFCTRTKFIAVVVLKIHWTSRSKDSKKLSCEVSSPQHCGQEKRKCFRKGQVARCPRTAILEGCLQLRKMWPGLYIQCHRIIHNVTHFLVYTGVNLGIFEDLRLERIEGMVCIQVNCLGLLGTGTFRDLIGGNSQLKF